MGGEIWDWGFVSSLYRGLLNDEGCRMGLGKWWPYMKNDCRWLQKSQKRQ